MNTTFQRFDSPEDYAAHLRSIASRHHDDGSSDFSGMSVSSALSVLENGDTTRLAQAQAIIDKLELAHLFSNDIPVLNPAVAGFIPNVPAAIAGHPESMFRRGFVESPSIMAPLAVYVETIVSGGVSQSQLIARGVAILAFVLAMETVRPVDLYAVTLSGKGQHKAIFGALTKIASRPMDLGRAVWMLTDPAYARRLHFTNINAQANDNGDYVPWAWFSNPTNEDYVPKMRELLSLQPEDVFMKGGYLFDQLMLDNPVAWVTKMIAEHSGKQNDAI